MEREGGREVEWEGGVEVEWEGGVEVEWEELQHIRVVSLHLLHQHGVHALFVQHREPG